MFKEHLEDHGVSYRDHQKLAFFFARESFKAAAMAVIHGVIPSLCETSASETHKKILPTYKAMLEEMQKK